MNVKIVIARDKRKTVLPNLNLDSKITVILECKKGEGLLSCKELDKSNILLIEIDLTSNADCALVSALRDRFSKLRIIAFMLRFDIDDLIEMHKLNIKSVATLNDIQDVSRIIQIVSDRGVYLTDQVMKVIDGHFCFDSAILNDFERRFLNELSKGKSSTALGEYFAKSPRTIEKYRHDLYLKLGVKNKEQLICQAFKRNLLS